MGLASPYPSIHPVVEKTPWRSRSPTGEIDCQDTNQRRGCEGASISKFELETGAVSPNPAGG